MPTYSICLRHPSISCPLIKDGDIKINQIKRGNEEEVDNKHKVKIRLALDHIIFYVVDAPSESAVTEYLREVGLSFYNDAQIREITLIREACTKYETAQKKLVSMANAPITEYVSVFE